MAAMTDTIGDSKGQFSVSTTDKRTRPVRLNRNNFSSVSKATDQAKNCCSSSSSDTKSTDLDIDDKNLRKINKTIKEQRRRHYKFNKSLLNRQYVETSSRLNNSFSSSLDELAIESDCITVSINSHNILNFIPSPDKKLTPGKDSKLKHCDQSKSDDSRKEDGSTSTCDSEMVSPRTDSNMDGTRRDVRVTEKHSSRLLGTRRNSGLLSIKKHDRIIVKPDFELEPVFAGYQLVGDSQLLRFAQQILSIPRKIDCNGKGWLGLCVGGQRICDLHRRVLSGEIPIGKRLIVLIGTNDLLKGTSISDMCKGLNSLLATLFKTARKIVVLTLPPVPKIAYLNEHWIKLKKYNEFIFTLRDHYHKTKLDVVDISPLFYQTKIKKCHLGFFELWFEGPVKRPDLIHINEVGFKLIRDSLLKQIM